MAKEKDLKEMTERELRDMGMKALENMRQLYADKRAGKEITADREAQVDAWELESRAVEQEFEARRMEALMAEKPKTGTVLPGTGIDTTEEKFDPNFKPSRRMISSALKTVERRGFKRLNASEKKVVSLAQREGEIFEKVTRESLVNGKVAAMENLNEEERAIFNNQQQRDKEVRAQSTTTTAGGYTIPQGFVPNVVRSLKFISAFFDEFTVGPNGDLQNTFTLFKTDSGNDLPMPTGDDTSNTGELLGEGSDASSSSADLVFGQITMKAYKYSTKMIKASTELLEDSAIDLPGYIGDMFGSRIGRILNTHLTTGDNSSKPQGIVTGASSGKVSASTSVTTFPEIIDLVHSVDPSYRNQPTARFMMHDNILLYLKKLTVGQSTTNARPLWQPSYDVSAPPTIDGYRYLINQGMASSVATGNKIILFGDMRGYGVRLVNSFRLLSLRERYAELDQTAWVGFLRADGRTLNSAAIKYLRIS
jgi:HK97 family phage major capsid protein